MSTGFLMFVEPQVRIPIWWAGIAFLVGWFIFSYPLIRSTKFEKVDGQIFMQKSKALFTFCSACWLSGSCSTDTLAAYFHPADRGAVLYAGLRHDCPLAHLDVSPVSAIYDTRSGYIAGHVPS